ncbi:hypothetical protein E3N88_44474 [Mikania micrantha]|uniref:Uncharacterized protein n=1 Tax=Mikania micrantha TaxID=192012 RepID=A0A5N6LBY6_9ASTR|nr:hypothetical protein E3N88_44474 [Mikania micrantha]
MKWCYPRAAWPGHGAIGPPLSRISQPQAFWGVPEPRSACHSMGRPCAACPGQGAEHGPHICQLPTANPPQAKIDKNHANDATGSHDPEKGNRRGPGCARPRVIVPCDGPPLGRPARKWVSCPGRMARPWALPLPHGGRGVARPVSGAMRWAVHVPLAQECRPNALPIENQPATVPDRMGGVISSFPSNPRLSGGTNLSDARLNLSGSWQQGHSATYNTRHVFKSSAKDSTRRLIRIVIQDSPHDSSIAQAKPMTRAFGGQGPYCWSANRRRAHALHLARILT